MALSDTQLLEAQKIASLAYLLLIRIDRGVYGPLDGGLLTKIRKDLTACFTENVIQAFTLEELAAVIGNEEREIYGVEGL